MSSDKLSGKTAIVTGGSRGIGLATARALVTAGAEVILTSRSQAAAEAAAETIGAGAVGFGAHVADEDAARRCIDFALATYGSIDILINNAGTNPAFGPLVDQDKARFAKTFDVNVWAPILWTKLAVEAWMGEHGGAIVNTASIGGFLHEAGLGFYNASKATIVHLTEQLALELGPRVRVNAVAPGVVRTQLARALWEEHEAEVAGATAMARIGEPDDIGAAIVFLVSEAASWITGTTLVVDGGQVLGDAGRFRPSAVAPADRRPTT
ncbi:SDR family oxidoreductase [Nocardia sp. NPDC047654]|uniref:SDR family oxidoreductase n=1 Tax=Nocardia sp. NPDC047654 TaxID=3364314 RepID=UPI00371F780F